jgi:hypothetical protein
MAATMNSRNHRYGPGSRSALKGFRATRSLLAISICVMIGPAPADAAIDYLVERPEITVTLEYQDKDESRSGPSIEPRREQTETFWQRLELQTRGWWYHPDLVLFSFGLEPQWKQQDASASNMFNRDDNNVFLGYFLDAYVLRQKSHSFKIFLLQNRNEFNSSLSPDNVTETDIARLMWIVDSELFPTSLTIESNDTKFEDFYATRDDSDILRLESKYSSEKHKVNLLSEYADQFRLTGVQRIEIDRFLTNINSNYALSDRARLMSTVFGVNSESDVNDSKSVLWSERLMLQHRANLRSDYTVRFNSRENDNFKTDTRFLSGAVEHQLYENLTSRLELYTNKDEFNDGEIESSQADLDFHYTRRIPVGRLTITNGYLYRREDNNIDAASSQVLNEPHTLVGTTPAFLDRTNVDPSSIIVTDSTKVITYVEGFDYFLTFVGDSVGIERSVFGGIANGETVLVDYVFATQAPFEVDRRAARFGVDLDLWRVLRLYFNFSRTEERLISGTRPSDLADDYIRRVGASLRWRWSTTMAEYEVRDTVRTPLDRVRLHQAFSFRVTPSLSFGASASYSETDFKESGNDSRTRRFAGNVRWDLGRWGRLEADAFLRDIDGESQKVDGDGLIARWSVRYGDWFGFVRFEELDEVDHLTTQERDRRLVTLHISRTFR